MDILTRVLGEVFLVLQNGLFFFSDFTAEITAKLELGC